MKGLIILLFKCWKMSVRVVAVHKKSEIVLNFVFKPVAKEPDFESSNKKKLVY